MATSDRTKNRNKNKPAGGGSGGGDGDPLTGDDRDAYEALVDYFKGLGIGDFSSMIRQYLIEGYSREA